MNNLQAHPTCRNCNKRTPCGCASDLKPAFIDKINEPAGPPKPAPFNINVAIDEETSTVVLEFNQTVNAVRLGPKIARQVAEAMKQASYRVQGPKQRKSA